MAKLPRDLSCSDVERALKRLGFVYLDALAFQPDTVLDAFVECLDMLIGEWAATRAAHTISELRSVLESATDEKTLVVCAILLAVFCGGAEDEMLECAQRQVLDMLGAAKGNAACWYGYLALLAHAQGDDACFRRAYAVYLDQPRRPSSLDTLLFEPTSRERRR